MKAIRVHELGGPEVLRCEEVAAPKPGPREALIKIAAAGVNYLDIYYRSGFLWGGHHARALPYTPGAEAAGIVVAVGPEVTEAGVGDRVAYGISNGQGAYAEFAAIPSWHLIRLPVAIDFNDAAAVMQQGMTAHYLADSTFPLAPGHTALVHAAAGGTGLLLVQIAKIRGARVIATVSTAEKAALAKAAGADEVILYTERDFAAEARRLTENRGVDVVYDSVGKTTYEKSLDALAPRGMLVIFGQSSGPVPPFDTAVLNAKGSLFLARPSLTHHVANHTDVLRRAGELFRWMETGRLKVHIGGTFPLDRAAEAHRRLASRATSGKLLLIP